MPRCNTDFFNSMGGDLPFAALATNDSKGRKLTLQSRDGNAPPSCVIGPLVFQGVPPDDQKHIGAVTTTAEKVKKRGMDEVEVTTTG